MCPLSPDVSAGFCPLHQVKACSWKYWIFGRSRYFWRSLPRSRLVSFSSQTQRKPFLGSSRKCIDHLRFFWAEFSSSRLDLFVSIWRCLQCIPVPRTVRSKCALQVFLSINRLHIGHLLSCGTDPLFPSRGWESHLFAKHSVGLNMPIATDPKQQ